MLPTSIVPLVAGLNDDESTNSDKIDFEDEFDQMVWEVTHHGGDNYRWYSLIDLEEVECPHPDTNENTNAAATQHQHGCYIHQMFYLTILQETLA